MNLRQSFVIEAPLDTVWAALADVERIAPCVPGAQLTDAAGDGTYRGTFSVKLGPATAAYRGELRMESLDDATHTATIRASGNDQRGQGSVKAAIVMRASADAAATRVEVDTDLTITGRLARFGRGGMMEDVSNRLLRELAACLQERLRADF